MKVITKEGLTSKEELGEMAKVFGDLGLVKAVVDVRQGIMAVGGQMHADEEVLLMEQHGSKREDTWGINIYSDKIGQDDWIEFDSMINIKAWMSNRSPSVESETRREKITEIVTNLIKQ